MARLGIPGIQIVYQNKRNEPNIFRVYFYLNTRKKSTVLRRFISNQGIERRISEFKTAFPQTKFPTRLGHMVIELNGPRADINLLANFPFFNRKLESLREAKTEKIFSGLGLGNYLELQTMLELKRRFPWLKTAVEGRAPSRKRKIQLGFRGQNFKKIYSIDEIITLIRAKLRKEIKTAKRGQRRCTPASVKKKKIRRRRY